MIRVLIADDQALVRAGFRVILESQDDIQVVGEAGNGHEAVAPGPPAAARTCILMDIRMPGLDGIEATPRVLRGSGTAQVRVLILTTFDLDEHVYAALAAGASGFLLKDRRRRDELVHADPRRRRRPGPPGAARSRARVGRRLSPPRRPSPGRAPGRAAPNR